MVVLSSGKVVLDVLDTLWSGKDASHVDVLRRVPLVRSAFIPISMLIPVASIGSAMMSVLPVKVWSGQILDVNPHFGMLLVWYIHG